MLDTFFAVFGALFAVVNPLGAVPVFLSLTPSYTKEERIRSAMFSSIYFVLILMTFFFAGSMILNFFGISLSGLRIAGGVVILSSGYGLLTGKFAQSRAVDKKVKDDALEKEDISFAPMAMPMLSGPGSISYLISQFAENPSFEYRSLIASTIVLTGIVVFLILRSSPYLFKLLGVSGLRAISRIMGFLVMAIGIEYVIGGMVALVNSFIAQIG